MNDQKLLNELKNTATTTSYRERFAIPLMVFAAIGVALVVVIIALNLYNSSGAAQLDLSRPGYQSVRDQVGKDVDIEAFSALGGLSSEVFESFDEQYSEQVKSITKLDAFGGKVLSDSTLGLPTVEDAQQ